MDAEGNSNRFAGVLGLGLKVRRFGVRGFARRLAGVEPRDGPGIRLANPSTRRLYEVGNPEFYRYALWL
jgi:hypothetical protein